MQEGMRGGVHAGMQGPMHSGMHIGNAGGPTGGYTGGHTGVHAPGAMQPGNAGVMEGCASELCQDLRQGVRGVQVMIMQL